MAKSPKSKALSDTEILSLVNDGIQAGVRFTDTKLAKERQKVMDYYNGHLPAPVHKGNSRYVSTDVFDTVESMKATLLETFSASSDILQFAPKNEEDVNEAQVASAYTKYVVFEQNAGTELFNEVMHDGLTARVGVAKVFWDDCHEEIEEEFEGYTEAQLTLLAADDEVLSVTAADDSDDESLEPIYSGTIVRREDRSQVRIAVLPPEEFIVDPNIASLEAAPEITHRTEKSKSDLIKEGYDRKLVAQLSSSDTELDYDPERITRFKDVDGGSLGKGSWTRQEVAKPYVIYETYASIDIDGEGVTKLWKIVHCGEVILDREQVDRHPFKTFVPLPTPHSFYGSNFAARVFPIQNAKTVLTRSILDHAVVTNNPRYGVVKGALTNPRELIDNRIGGLVNVTRADGIFPLPQAPLNPYVFQTVAMLDEDKEDTTGVSRLSQGLNKDAISNQNSEGMVEKLIGASMQRQKIIARAFATQFLKPLWLEVYRLVVENERRETIVDVAGSFVPVTPSSWRKMRDVSIDLRLGYGEQDRLASEYMQFGKALSEDPAMGPSYGPQQRFNLYKAVMEAKGHKNVSAFLADPKTLPPPSPDPKAAAELALLKQELELNQRKQELAEKEAEVETRLQELKVDYEKRFAALEYALKAHDQQRKEAETANRIDISQQEMDLARQAQEDAPPENDKATAIISPNG